MIYHIQKDLWSLDAQNPPKMFDFWNFLKVERHLTQFIWVSPYEILVFLMNFIFQIILWGKKRTALFQNHIWEKSSFFSTLVRVFARLYANMQQGGTMCPPPVLIGLMIGDLVIWWPWWLGITNKSESRKYVVDIGYMRLIWWRSLNDMLKTYRSAVVLLLIEKVSVLILLSQGAGLHDIQSIRSLFASLTFAHFVLRYRKVVLYSVHVQLCTKWQLHQRRDVQKRWCQILNLKTPQKKRESVKVWSFQPPDHTLKSKGPFLKRCNVQRC